MGTEDTHDVYEGEIPANVGKKNNGLLKVVGLIALVGVLGAAAYVLNMEESKQSMMDDTKDAVQDFMTSKMPEVSEPEQQGADPEETIASSTEQSVPSESEVIDINLDETDTAATENPTQGLMDIGREITEAVNVDPVSYSDDSDPITITPPDNATDTKVSSNYASQSELSQLRDKVMAIETSDQERINVIRSGIELQTASIDRLNNLLETLDGLKRELAELNKSSVQRTVSTKTKPKANQTSNPSPKPAPEATPVVERNGPDLILLGIDRWGDEKFAQIQDGDQIHLLAKHEVLNGWRVTRISQSAITVVNDNGDSFEIKN